MRNAAILKLNVSPVTSKGVQPAEFYKKIPEDHFVNSNKVKSEPPTTTGGNANAEKVNRISQQAAIISKKEESNTAIDGSKMVQEENAINDGADEQMLGNEERDKLSEKREEVKFIKGGDQQNGDAKIDICVINGKTFTGMTKEELMKYANDPFWVRLRWIFFIAFWAIWVGMLVGAILIIIDAPKCAAPEPLPWYKRGPLAKFQALDVGANDVISAKRVQATGAIYELPAALTYSVREPAVEQKIKDIVANYKDSGVNVILDITPNYVPRDSEILKNAMSDAAKRSAFIWIEGSKIPNNWLSIVNGSAWSELQSNNYVLSQFGDGLFDLNMNSSIVKKEFGDVLQHLLQLGIKGFRLKNTKFFLLSPTIKDEVPSGNNFIHDEYGFWTHTQTTFQDGLGDYLYELVGIVKNITADAFVSVAEDIVRPEAYRTSTGQFGIEMPMYGRFPRTLGAPQNKQLQSELQDLLLAVGNDTWMQWNFAEVQQGTVDPSAVALFFSLLPGVPIMPMSANSSFHAVPDGTYEHIEQLRLSPSYMHGEFEMYQANNLIAYARIKSGNPGYFVVFNPLDVGLVGNFSGPSLPDKMTVDAVSGNYNVTDIEPRSKLMTHALEVSPYSTIILTYVPVKLG